MMGLGSLFVRGMALDTKLGPKAASCSKEGLVFGKALSRAQKNDDCQRKG